MSKLGIAIKVTKEGNTEPIVVNKGSWTSYVDEIRDELKLIKGLENYDKVVRFVSFCEEGSLLTIARTISGRVGDNVAAWIYIPNDIMITGEELCDISKKVVGILMGSRIEINQLEEVVGCDFPTKKISIRFIPSVRNGGYAYREIGYFPLQDILGENRYQNYYSKYKCVFIIDSSEGVSIADNANAVNLTTQPIEKLCTLYAPSINDIVSYFGQRSHVSIKYEKNKNIFEQFNSPILVRKGSKIKLRAERDGFQPKEFFIEVSETEQSCDLNMLENPRDWFKYLSRDMFYVTEDGKPLNDCKILLNNTVLTEHGLLINEKDCSQVHVVVYKQGYDKYENLYNLREPFNNIPVELRKEEKSHEYEVSLNNGDSAKLSFASRKQISKAVPPLVGYRWDQQDRIVVNEWYKWNRRLEGFAVGTGVVLLYILISWLVSKYNEDTPIPNDYSDAISYLDNNEGWKKSEMDTINGLNGLWEAMNNYNFHEIKDVANTINNSDKLNQLVVAINGLPDDWSGGNGEHSPKYNNEGYLDVINMNEYIYWISEGYKRQPSKEKAIADAIDYLDKHKNSRNVIAWVRSDLESFEPTKGLWDAMNTYNFDAIINNYSGLDNSNNFKTLLSWAKKNIDNSWNPRPSSSSEHQPNYNTDVNDYVIVFNN